MKDYATGRVLASGRLKREVGLFGSVTYSNAETVTFDADALLDGREQAYVVFRKRIEGRIRD